MSYCADATAAVDPTPEHRPPAGGTLARRLWDMDDEEVEELFDGPGGR